MAIEVGYKIINNHPDQNTRSQGQALLNTVGDDMGIDRNFLSGLGTYGNYRKQIV